MKKGKIISILLILFALISACASDMAAPAPAEEAPAPVADDSEPMDAAEAPAAEDEWWPGDFSGEDYLVITENLAISTDVESTITFSLQVDTAAYNNVFRLIENGIRPPRDAVRTEELINFFTFDNPMVFSDDSPFAISVEIGPSPFNENHHLAFIRVSTIDIDRSELPPSNLTFFIDTSGSMRTHDKLPLIQQSFGLFVENLTENDRISIVTYGETSRVLLDGVSGAEKDIIMSAVNSLEARGSTSGEQGIQAAFALAEANFIPDANNRVILATDGNFDVSGSTERELAELINQKRDTGVYFSIFGFGIGNLRDDIMETLAREGSGNYFHINNLAAARKALVDEMTTNLYVIANDVMAQVEFNPQNVKSYRLIGYENRRLANVDFGDDTVGAGDIGVNADVVVMFELELHDEAQLDFADELFDVRIRYKNPGEDESRLITYKAFFDNIVEIGSADFRFATAVAAFAHLLRESEHIGDVTIDDVQALAEDSQGNDEMGHRRDFLRLLELYKQIVG